MRRLLFILLLSGLASGCATTSEVGPVRFGTGVEKAWGTGGEIRSHWFSYTEAQVNLVAEEYCLQQGLHASKLTYMGMVPPGIARAWRSYNFECSKPTAQPAQQQDLKSLRLSVEGEAAKQKVAQQELEEKLRQSRQPPPPTRPVLKPNTDRLSLEASKKCTEYGFKPATATFEKCVLKLLSK